MNDLLLGPDAARYLELVRRAEADWCSTGNWPPHLPARCESKWRPPMCQPCGPSDVCVDVEGTWLS